MRSLKNIVGIVGALIGIAYCGGLILYFVGSWGELGTLKALLDIEDGMAGANAIGLKPTIFGLGAVGSVFVAILVIRILRMLLRHDPPSGGSSSRPGGTAIDHDAGGVDADSMIARYLASRSAEAAAPAQPVASRPAAGRNPGPQRPSFGRRTR